MSPYRSPAEVLVTRADLIPVDALDWNSSPEELRKHALRLLSAAVQKEDAIAEKAAKEAKEWELKHAVPLARTMYNSFHNFSSNYREDITEDLWIKYYEERHTSTMAWVATASAVLKEQEAESAE